MNPTGHGEGAHGTWREAALVLVALAAFANAAWFARRTTPPPLVASAAPPDAVLGAEARLAPLREAMDRHAVGDVVGYAGDVAPPELWRTPDALQRYYLAQFALAPRVLDPHAPEREWLVIDSSGGALAARVPDGFRLVDEWASGVGLARRERP